MSIRVRVKSSKHSSVNVGIEGTAVPHKKGYAVTFQNFIHKFPGDHSKPTPKETTIFFEKKELEFLK